MRNPASFTYEFRLPFERPAVFELFSSPSSLDQLTPNFFRLIPRGELPRPLGTGCEINYRLRWRGLPLPWTSLLTDWRAPEFLAYEQQRGPYRFFRHEHVFEECDGGTLVRDIVHYLCHGGRAVEALVVRPELRRIFEFRHRRAAAILGAPQASG